MSKNQFKNPKARYTGAALFEQDQELTDLANEEASDRLTEDPKTHSFTMLPSYIDKMRNYVHHIKMTGDPYYTQGLLIQEALDKFFQDLETEIPERPNHVKRAEKKRTGRRKRIPTKNENNDLGF